MIKLKEVLKYCLVTHEYIIKYDKNGFSKVFKEKEYYDLLDLLWIVTLFLSPFMLIYLALS